MRQRSLWAAYSIWLLLGITGAHWFYIHRRFAALLGLAQMALAIWVALALINDAPWQWSMEPHRIVKSAWTLAMAGHDDSMALIALMGAWAAGGLLLPVVMAAGNMAAAKRRWKSQAKSLG